MSKLEPCPFCGSKDLYLLNREDRFYLNEYYIFCNLCKTSFSNERAEDYENDTIKWWNSIVR